MIQGGTAIVCSGGQSKHKISKYQKAMVSLYFCIEAATISEI